MRKLRVIAFGGSGTISVRGKPGRLTTVGIRYYFIHGTHTELTFTEGVQNYFDLNSFSWSGGFLTETGTGTERGSGAAPGYNHHEP